VLTPDELSQRIKAARLLRGLTQDELADRLRDAGLSWRLAGKLERGEKSLREVHRLALSNALGFPERWFTAPLDDLCPEVPNGTVAEELQRTREMLQTIIDRLEES
jgi:transcriptional regulator with XRE-family HTH domain